MTDLVTWLRVQIDADEAAANAAGRYGWHYVLSDGDFLMDLWGDAGGGLIAEAIQPRFMEHIARHDPARVLADVAAKRAIMDLHETATRPADGFTCCRSCIYPPPCATLRHLAYAYHVAGAGGWREAWRP